MTSVTTVAGSTALTSEVSNRDPRSPRCPTEAHRPTRRPSADYVCGASAARFAQVAAPARGFIRVGSWTRSRLRGSK